MAQTPQTEHVPGRLLVKGAVDVSDAEILRHVSVNGATVHHRIEATNVFVLDAPEPALDAIAAALSKTGRFAFVERDFIAHGAAIPNDPDYPSQWHLAKIQAPGAWNLTDGSATVPIAIIDSGLDFTHPDLAPKIIPGWNFLTGTSNVSDTGANGGHGTAVSGTAGAATNNLTGVAGVGWANTIMPLVVLDSNNSATYSNIASAINYAADHGARIISISIGGPTASSTLQTAVDYAWGKGAVIFAAAMNNSSSAPSYPAACNNVLGISATEPDDTLASFSNYGSWIKLSAPGDSIMTTEKGGGYWSCWGTSFATPIAAAVGALALSANPSLTASALVALLEKNSDDLGTPGFDNYFGYGRVNAYKAVAAAKGVIADTTAPTVSISSPASGATVSGTVSVQGTASDNVGVTKVEFYVDGSLYATGASSPFSFSWSASSSANGSHTLSVKAYDAAGNTKSSALSVNLNNPDTTPPTVSISSPLPAITVAGTVLVTGTASDNRGVTKIEFYVDGNLSLTATLSPFSFSWNTTSLVNGSHTVTVKAYDAAGNNRSASVTDTVSNTTGTQPLLQIHGDASEVTAVTNGSVVKPGTAPAGFTGQVIVKGTGAVNFVPAKTGNGVYFLNCCTNTNNAYYKFTGTTVGNIFKSSQGQIAFYLKSRYSFAQRTTSAASKRYVFDARDGNGHHLYYFLTEVISGYLQFHYSIDGVEQYYYVPKGTEDALFGSGVLLNVKLTWSGGTVKLYLNGALIKSSAYTAVTPNWTSASVLDLGAYEYLSYGGYNISDDVIDEFTVN